MVDVPVAILIFRRPDLTRELLKIIHLASPSKLYVIADGAREGNREEGKLVEQTRAIVDDFAWDCEVIKIFSDSNLGLAQRVTSGLDFVFSREEFAIVLEDDCHPSQDFFSFAHYAEANYRGKSDVALVSGTNLTPIPWDVSGEVLTTEMNIWGWLTWSDYWREFRMECPDLVPDDNNLGQIRSFHLRRSLSAQLQHEGKLDSWALAFVLFCVGKGWLSVKPKVNLVNNLGFGAGSTHTKFESYAHEQEIQHWSGPAGIPIQSEQTALRYWIETCLFYKKWIVFPVLHPWDFLKRVSRYLRLRVT